MNSYEHTQPGTLVRAVIGSIALLLSMILIRALLSGNDVNAVATGTAISLAVSVALLVLFHSLTVCVSRHEVSIAFGIGLIRKTIPVADIQAAFVVRTDWSSGWGIRLIRSGWLYNISGFDAVEIGLRNDRRFQIGTDQPDELQRALQTAIESSGNSLA